MGGKLVLLGAIGAKHDVSGELLHADDGKDVD